MIYFNSLSLVKVYGGCLPLLTRGKNEQRLKRMRNIKERKSRIKERALRTFVPKVDTV